MEGHCIYLMEIEYVGRWMLWSWNASSNKYNALYIEYIKWFLPFRILTVLGCAWTLEVNSKLRVKCSDRCDCINSLAILLCASLSALGYLVSKIGRVTCVDVRFHCELNLPVPSPSRAGKKKTEAQHHFLQGAVGHQETLFIIPLYL
jgi:hypothetical protein